MVNNINSSGYSRFDEGFKPADPIELEKYTRVKDICAHFHGVQDYVVNLDRSSEIKVGHVKQLIYQNYNVSTDKKICIIYTSNILKDADSFFKVWDGKETAHIFIT